MTESTESTREPRATILVVDDDDGVRRISRRMLERSGYHVLEAATGPEALDVAASHEGAIDLMV
ncbi:response regulator, partial [Longimicrobium sp.]|uniref:response regulator n=1 Tax=Longimicrobium sp. TaxID=2029185 RepID=UPI002F91E3B5